MSDESWRGKIGGLEPDEVGQFLAEAHLAPAGVQRPLRVAVRRARVARVERRLVLRDPAEAVGVGAVSA